MLEAPSLDRSTREVLLRDLAALVPDADAQIPSAEVLRSFLPLPSHARALHDRVLVVKGARGVGKTALFRFLSAAAELKHSPRELLADPRVVEASWVEGYSAWSLNHPFASAIRQFASEHSDNAIRAYWLGSLAGVLEKEGLELPPWFAAIWHRDRHEPGTSWSAATLHLGPLSAAIDAFDQALVAKGRRVVVTYDHLDRLKLPDRGSHRVTSVLVDLWQSLASRLRAIRCKLFLRSDLLDAIGAAWPDAPKVLARVEDLRWSEPELFRLLARLMGAQSRPLREWLERSGFAFADEGVLGAMPRSTFAEEDERRRLMTLLVGTHMGSGVRKGYSDRWVLARSRDGRGELRPRAAIRLLAFAAAHRQRDGGKAEGPLLEPKDLMAALSSTSIERVGELADEHDVVHRLDALRGEKLPITRSEFANLLGVDAAEVLEKLVAIGAVARHPGREEDIFDVPDIYRFHFGIKRKGGPQLPARPLPITPA